MNIQRPKSKQPLPEDAKKVFDGVIYDVYQWEQTQFDGSKATFEKLKRMDTVMVIPVTLDKKIILLEQEQPGKEAFLGLPGGRADDGEDPLKTAQRELMEETGYKAQSFELFIADQPMSKIEWAVYTFVGKRCEKVGEQSLDSGEKIQMKFFSFDEFVDLVLDEKFGDPEISLKIARAKLNNKLEDIKQLFFN